MSAGAPLPATCRRGVHPLVGDDVALLGGRRWRCLPCARRRTDAYRRRTWDRRHLDHDVRLSVSGRRTCRTCRASRAARPEVDEVAVRRAAAGDPPDRLRPVDRAEAVVRLRGRGLTHAAIAERVGCSVRTVERVLARTRRGPVAA